MKNDDSELIQRTLEGDQQAFAQLVEKYQEQIHILAWQKIGDFHIAQEITQDVFLTAYQKFPTFTHYRQFAGWLYVVTNRKCIAWHRKKKIETQSIDETNSIELEEAYYSEYTVYQREEAAKEKRRTIVHKLLSKLQESERTVMSLFYLAEMSCEEIAEFLGVAPNTVRSRLHRARNRLKKEEAVIQENLSSFQLPTQLTENIINEISRLNPATPSGSKPLVPLGISVVSAIIVFLLIGFGTQNLIPFQQPYSLESTSEQTVEIVDAPIVLESPAKPAVNNQVSRSDVLTNNDGTGQNPDTPLLAAAQSDDAEISTSKAQWGQTNGPYGGGIEVLFVTTEGILFAGTDGAGIFRSTDGGDSWTPADVELSDEFDDLEMYVLVFEEKEGTIYASVNGDLYASNDDGNTWQNVLLPQVLVSVSSIMVIDDRIYIGTINSGIWYTDDSVSWIPVNDGLTNLQINELANIGTTLIVGTEWGGAFRKKETEDSWHPINSGFIVPLINQEQANNIQTESALHSSQRPQLPSKIGIDSFAVMDNLLFVSAVWEKGGGLFRSDDEGDTWIRIAAEEITDKVSALAVYGTTLYAGTSDSGVFHSNDKGDSWTAVNNGLTYQGVSDLLSVNENTVFVGTTGGIFRTTDSGNSWVETNTGLINTSVKELEIVGKKIYANFFTNIVHSVDGGESWQPVKMLRIPIEYRWPTLSVSNGELYISAFRYDSRERGGRVGCVFRLDEENNALVELIVHRNLARNSCMEVVGTTFYIGTWNSGVFRCQWEMGSGPEVINLGLDGHYISMLSVNEKKVYAITGENEIYRLQDEGKPWERIHIADMTDDNISDIRWVGSVLYVSTWNNGVFSSINGGDSWTLQNNGLDETSASSIGTDGTELYIGTINNGVYRWIEDKKHWEQLGSLHRQVLSLAVLDGFLYAGTASGGVFRIKIEQ